MTPGEIVLAVVVVFAILIAILIIIRSPQNTTPVSRMNEEGVIIYGIVQDKQTVRLKGGTWYYLLMHYQYDGVDYTQKLSVKRSRYDELSAGDQISLVCLPAYPASIMLAEDLDRL